MVASLMAGCIGEDEPYPPLDKAEIVGCWVLADPSTSSFECTENCYSGTGLFYHRVNSTRATGVQGIVEFSGTYTISKNTVRLTVMTGNNVDKPDSSLKQLDDPYTIMRDTLFSITSIGLNPYVRADSSNTCGPHWQVFPKPENWDLN